MNILAITPFTGSEQLVSMTEDCIEFLLQSELPPDVRVRVLAVNNGASRQLNLKYLNEIVQAFRQADQWEPIEELVDASNNGFGIGVNRGIDLALYAERWPVDQILVFNNDLQFTQKDWLVKLLAEVETAYVLSPRTDVTATPEARYPEAADKPATRSSQVSAFCWLVPRRVIDAIDSRWSFPLFHPEFTNYGSDDATAAILRKLYGATPFKIVNRSWVRHLKAQTANELGVKAGTEQLLSDLKKWMRCNKLK